MGGLLVFFIGLLSILVSLFSWFATKSGPNQTIIRSSVLLTIACCYIMWAVVYIAQLHPIINPKKSL